MKIKEKVIYENIEELKAAADKGTIKVGDELQTKDIDGKCKFVIIKTGEEIHLVRKYLLSEDRPMRRGGCNYLMDWLSNDYKDSLKTELKDVLVDVFLLSEKEVFGTNEWAESEETGEQYDYFKKCKNRIATYKKDSEYSHCWWLRSVVSASAFAAVNYGGLASNASASNALGIRPALKISVENA